MQRLVSLPKVVSGTSEKHMISFGEALKDRTRGHVVLRQRYMWSTFIFLERVFPRFSQILRFPHVALRQGRT